MVREFNLLDPLNRHKEEEIKKKDSAVRNYRTVQKEGNRLIAPWNECISVKCDLNEIKGKK